MSTRTTENGNRHKFIFVVQTTKILLMPEHRCFGHSFDVLMQAVKTIEPQNGLGWRGLKDHLIPTPGMFGAHLMLSKERIYPHNLVPVAKSIFHTPQHWHNEHTPTHLAPFLYGQLCLHVLTLYSSVDSGPYMSYGRAGWQTIGFIPEFWLEGHPQLPSRGS